MRWLGLLLVLVVGRASAAPCGRDDVKAFPAAGAGDVPTNTHLWVRADVPGPYALVGDGVSVAVTAKPFGESPFLEIDPGPLLPQHGYQLTARGVGLTFFITGTTTARMPPPPVIDHAHITNGVLDMPVRTPGAVMIHVWIYREQRHPTDPLAQLWCSRPGVRGVDLSLATSTQIKPGDSLCFWVASVGPDGLDSPVTVRCATSKQPHDDPPAPTPTPVPTARPPTSESLLMPLACGLVLALLYIAWRGGRERLYAKVCERQPIERVSVAWLARRQLVHRLIALAIVAAAAYMVLPIAALGVIVVADLWRLVRVARAVATGWPVIADPPRCRAYVTDGLFFQGWITVGPRDLARVAAAHIPTARVTRG